MNKSKNVNFRLDSDLEKPVEYWLKQNNMTMSTLNNMAIREFISREHTLKSVTLVEVSDAKANDTARKMMSRHADTLEKLK